MEEREIDWLREKSLVSLIGSLRFFYLWQRIENQLSRECVLRTKFTYDNCAKKRLRKSCSTRTRINSDLLPPHHFLTTSTPQRFLSDIRSSWDLRFSKPHHYQGEEENRHCHKTHNTWHRFYSIFIKVVTPPWDVSHCVVCFFWQLEMWNPLHPLPWQEMRKRGYHCLFPLEIFQNSRLVQHL